VTVAASPNSSPVSRTIAPSTVKLGEKENASGAPLIEDKVQLAGKMASCDRADALEAPVKRMPAPAIAVGVDERKLHWNVTAPSKKTLSTTVRSAARLAYGPTFRTSNPADARRLHPSFRKTRA
jgi:hypothetical protein